MGKYHIYRRNLKFILPIVLIAAVTGGAIELSLISQKSKQNNNSSNVNENYVNSKGKNADGLKPLNLYEKESEEDIIENLIYKKYIPNYRELSSDQNSNITIDELSDSPVCLFTTNK